MCLSCFSRPSCCWAFWLFLKRTPIFNNFWYAGVCSSFCVLAFYVRDKWSIHMLLARSVFSVNVVEFLQLALNISVNFPHQRYHSTCCNNYDTGNKETKDNTPTAMDTPFAFPLDLSVSNSLTKASSVVCDDFYFCFVTCLVRAARASRGARWSTYSRFVFLMKSIAKIAEIKGFLYRQAFSITVSSGKPPTLRNDCQISRLSINSSAIACPVPTFHSNIFDLVNRPLPASQR